MELRSDTKQQLLQYFHGLAIEGHSEVLATTQTPAGDVYWKGLQKDVRD